MNCKCNHLNETYGLNTNKSINNVGIWYLNCKKLFMVLLSRIEIGWFRVFTNERKFSFLLLYLKIAINVNEKTSPNGQIDIVCLLSWEFQTIRWNNYYIPFVQFCIFEVLWHTQAILKALVIFDVSETRVIFMILNYLSR